MTAPGLEGLNPPQREAVEHDAGPLVVFAGAGSGKTRVITHRVAHLVVEHELAPWNILAVTFTNKAAQEMRSRLRPMLDGGAGNDVWVGTFHATCARLLRRHAAELGLRRDFTIYDDADQRAMVTRVLRDMGLDEKRYQPRSVAGAINRAKQEVRDPTQMEVRRAFDEVVQRVYVAYEEHMAKAQALDFGDLIYRMVRALEGEPEVRDAIVRRFRHVLVDEFQDTNHAQYRLVRALVAGHQQVTVVGDDDQSIYRWRGADRRNILDFTRDFPSATVIKLEQNYRSTQRILRAAHAIIEKNFDREEKRLWTENPEGPKLTVLTCSDERQEAQLLVRAVQELASVGRSLDEVALFYRIHAQSRVFEDALRAANVPYRVVGGLRFYDRAEIKDMLAYLRVLSNPDDDVSLLRIINTPPRGIGKKSVETVLDRAAETGVGVLEAARAVAASGKKGAPKKLGAFMTLMDELAADAANGMALHVLAKKVFDETGYGKWLVDQDTPEAESRIENVGELVGAMEEVVQLDPSLTLADFLEQVTLDSGQPEDEGEGEPEARLTLMTVHAAKGLEFPVVMIGGLEEQMFPYRGVEDEDEEELEEERRLAYVAVTRAKERLILSWAQTRRIFGRLRPGIPSRFLAELPPDDVESVGGRRAPAPPKRAWDRQGALGGRRAAAPKRRAVAAGDSYVDRSEGSDLDPTGLAVGMRVRHRKFGVGKVEDVKPTLPPRADVRFPDWGLKTIRVDFLEPA